VNEISGGSENDGPRASDSRGGHVVHANPPAPKQPVDAPVIGVSNKQQTVLFTIGLPSSVEDGQVTSEWTGLFVIDDKTVKGTDFKILQIRGREVRAELAGTKLPSYRVRLYEPGYPK
jgi:hypothetical protein